MRKSLCVLSAVFAALVFCAAAYAAVEPVITVNGMAGTVHIAEDSAVTISVQLSPGTEEGQEADWWIAVSAFGRWYGYNLSGEFSDLGDSPDIGSFRPVYQGALFTLPSSLILEIPQMPAGTYSLYFGVDMNMNGNLDADSLVLSELNIISDTSKALKSDLTRNLSPDVILDDLYELISGNSAFALNFYQAIRTGDGNLFFSPYSISNALAMMYAGAAGDTDQQMKNTLHFTLPHNRLHSAFNALDIMMSSLSGHRDDVFRLNIANSLWGQNDYPFLSSFLDVIAGNYSAALNRTDFIRTPEESRITINNWVSENTEQKIQDLLPENSVDSSARLVLVNAIYFNAPWASPFDAQRTHDDVFYHADGTQNTLPMMQTADYFRYADGDGYKAVELSYKHGSASMMILLPDAGRFDEIEKALTPALLSGIAAKLSLTNIALEMPKFRYESGSMSLKDTLSEMGMPVAFTWPGADFSGMDGTFDLYIGDVFHKAFISVDEAGTEAAAATAVAVLAGSAAPPTPMELKINRPFIFFIMDRINGTILFMGRMINPAE
ncbi:MAG: serpin family protein [Desulfococcaceae bacterium]